jgi:hypothetical protein
MLQPWIQRNVVFCPEKKTIGTEEGCKFDISRTKRKETKGQIRIIKHCTEN